MAWRRRQEGYLLVDNSFAVRNAPNPYLSEADLARARAAGCDVSTATVPRYESATITCSHCNTLVVLRPDRTRPREYCPACDAYVCDSCGYLRSRGQTCLPMVKRLDILQKRAEMTIARGRI